jgi:hypothetical protein
MPKRPASPKASGDPGSTEPGPSATPHGGSATGHGAASDAPKMTPAAAVARHIEWLEYALGAARAEEGVRAERLEKATKKNRSRRTDRLAEVRDEIAELTVLLAGIRDLEAKARGTRARKPAAPRTRGTAASRTSGRRRPTAGTAAGS